jgi:hypothetical protein
MKSLSMEELALLLSNAEWEGGALTSNLAVLPGQACELEASTRPTDRSRFATPNAPSGHFTFVEPHGPHHSLQC